MTNKPKRPDRDEQQSRRFIEKAREIADDSAEEKFDRAFRKIVPPSKPKKSDSPK